MKKFWASKDLTELNKYRPWSVLWENLAWFNLIDLRIRKIDYVVDTRLNRDMFLNDHYFTALCIIMFIGWIIYMICSRKYGTIWEYISQTVWGKYEVEYDYKLKDLVELNEKNERDARIHPADWIE